MRAWFALSAAVGLEVFGTLSLKFATLGGFPLGGVITAVCVALSYVLLAQAFKSIPVAVAFAVWEAAGLALITVLGTLLLGEALTPLRVAALLGLVAGAWLLRQGTQDRATQNRTAQNRTAQNRTARNGTFQNRGEVGV